MKKLLILAAFAAMLTLSGCQEIEVGGNEAVEAVKTQESPVFTAAISAPTKTTVNVSDGKVAWETTDKITVKDGNGATAVYGIESIDATTGKAIFVIEQGETALSAGPYSAAYGTEPETSQTYSANVGQLYMTAPATSGTTFTFTVQCGLMELKLTKSGESVKSVKVTGTTGTYTLTCSSPESINSENYFYIALPAGSYTKIEITNASGNVATLNSTSGVAVAANHIKPVTLGDNKISFIAPAPLSGKFTIDKYGHKVSFSRGNLQATYNGTSYTWGFAENQYDYVGNAAGNTTIGTSQSPGAVVDLFGWSATDCKSTEKWGISTSTKNTDYGKNTYIEKGGIKITSFDDWSNDFDTSWRTLSDEEWTYVLNTRTNANSLYRFPVTVNGHSNCLILAPDNYTKSIESSYTATTWNTAEAEGLVCLPAAGKRSGSNVTSTETAGRYWTSTPYLMTGLAEDEYCAVCLYFYNGQVTVDVLGMRAEGKSVRLVRAAE